jgi:hypothetical protein
MNSIARTVALSVVGVLALSGCLRYNIDITLDSDNTASGSIVMAVQTGVGEQLGVDSDEAALDELFSDNPFADETAMFSQSDYAEDDYVGDLYTFNGVALAQLNASFTDSFMIERVGDEFVVSSETAPTSEGEMEELPTGAESLLTITFPGTVTAHNGTLEDNTVTWDLFTQTEPLSATADASSGSAFPLWLIFVALGILVLLAGLAVVVVLVVRNQKGAAPTAMTLPLAPPAPPAAPLAPPAPPAATAPPTEPGDKQE